MPDKFPNHRTTVLYRRLRQACKAISEAWGKLWDFIGETSKYKVNIIGVFSIKRLKSLKKQIFISSMAFGRKVAGDSNSSDAPDLRNCS